MGDWVVIEAGSHPYVDYPRHQVVSPRCQGPPPHAPAHGVRKKYQYRYYPDQGIYYDMVRRHYYRREGGKELVVIVGQERALNLALTREQGLERKSLLATRLGRPRRT